MVIKWYLFTYGAELGIVLPFTCFSQICLAVCNECGILGYQLITILLELTSESFLQLAFLQLNHIIRIGL
jgi:hypothetical protein